jgi:hypothetical protein
LMSVALHAAAEADQENCHGTRHFAVAVGSAHSRHYHLVADLSSLNGPKRHSL